jgi:hypothetical protein
MALADRLGRPVAPQEEQRLEDIQEATGFGD